MKRAMHGTVVRIGGIALGLLAGRVGAQQAADEHYRLSNASPASVAAMAQSSAYSVAIAGGSGMPVGIAASDGGTIVAGPGSAPSVEHIFADSFESH